ncbi:MAG TPA: lipid-A-disaccharide synthase [Steroidobacteraceae bacterium]|nr:lipid-A-disaccharide synthase [Steroidobacteraceae bacterium]
MATESGPLSIGFVAGESSGDQLGAALITALRARVPALKCFGVAGPKMAAAGCEAWAGSDELAVMGLTEVVRHLPRILRLRGELHRRFLAARPDVFIGIDSPEFNLGLAAKLHRAGITTVQYVSPQVWAWRQGRVAGIARACDLVLCLLPFETPFYSKHGVAAQFVGHPLADLIPLEPDRAAARRELGVPQEGLQIALLPGSRLGEVERLGADFLAAARYIRERRPGVGFLAPMASPAVRAVFERQLAATPVDAVLVLEGGSHRALAAADGVIVASGTATLEALLFGRPMVAAYRFAAFTAFLIKHLRLVKVPYFSQPNLLLGRARVPEFFQDAVAGPALGEALLRELEPGEHRAELALEFRRVHEELRQGGAERAASAILELLAARTDTAIRGRV